ncbi:MULTISPECIES: transcriptional regulator [unclassified Collinsella]|uniref:transcriptional regulator n=1 Tax=unclassified Collinsella TaxID=2637548 RepID=UPI0018CC50C6|nr:MULTISPECIES: transcriptional regulator [unclassified Collinsella]
MAFTETLKAVMDAKNLRSVDITSDEITAPYLSRLLKGKVKEPTWQKALVIINSLDMTVDEFCDLEAKLNAKHDSTTQDKEE